MLWGNIWCIIALAAHFNIMFIIKADVSLSKQPGETCPSTDPDCNLRSKHQRDYKLYRIDGVKTGFIQNVTIDGITYKLITRSMKPPLFEIPKFLSDDECDRIVHLAKKEGLEESGTLNTDKDDFAFNTNETRKVKTNQDDNDDEPDDDEIIQRCKSLLEDLDKDKNGQISALELTPFFENFSTSALKERDIRTMLLELNFDKDKDGELSLQECIKTNTSALEVYLDTLEDSNPLYRTRYSRQAWLTANNDSENLVLLRLQTRIIDLTKLPREMIEKSEQLQVVRYTVNGHFHSHYDSTLRRGRPCCMNTEDLEGVAGESCNLCRYMTILYYLNDVPEGGETAFPIADNATYDEQEYQRRGLENLSVRCHESNIVVKPAKGKAVLWYNHHIDPNTGGMGIMDEYSLHGGCDVKKGTKWIANNWLNVPYMHT